MKSKDQNHQQETGFHYHITSVCSAQPAIPEVIVTNSSAAISAVTKMINSIGAATGAKVIKGEDHVATFTDGSTVTWRVCDSNNCLDHIPSQESHLV